MWHDDDDLEDAGDLDLDTREPMKPIRLRYVTLSSERELLIDTMERLGLAHAWVGHTLYALNECETNSLRMDAREALYKAGAEEPSEHQLTTLMQAMLVEKVMADRVAKSLAPELVGQLLRAEADVTLATRGHEIRQDVMHRIAEVEAA